VDADILALGYQTLARLKQAQGDTAGARQVLKEFEHLARQYHYLYLFTGLWPDSCIT
jgi:ATP/maltotriose-dependent transcriptional regulator MalT